jgi:simple sugar transport system permease protein
MVPVLLPAIGETVTELAGVFNIGIEGIMLLSGITVYFVALATGDIMTGVMAALLVGAVAALVTAYCEVTLRVDQVVFGIGLYIFGLAFSSFLHVTYSSAGEFGRYTSIPTIRGIHIPLLSDLPYVGFLFSQNVVVYLSVIIVGIAWFVLDKTWLGLKIRAIGQDPAVADSLGIRVLRYRYLCLVVSGILAAVGGSYLIIALSGMWIGNITAGRGFVAFALLRLGSWRPWRIALASLAYGVLTALQATLQVLAPAIPSQLFQIIPYVMAIVFLGLAKSWMRERQPRSLGIPYSRE